MMNRLLFASDFNIDSLETNPSNGILSFKELILSEFFFPTIDVPTRVTETSRTCIDHIYTNCVQPILSGALHCDISDHHAILCTSIAPGYFCLSTQSGTIERNELILLS